MDLPENGEEGENPLNYDAMAPQWPQLSESNLIDTSVAAIRMPNSMVESSSRSFYDANIANEAAPSTSHGLTIWAQHDAMLQGNNVLLPSVPPTIPPILPHFPADLGFVERAARFSCFFGDAPLNRFPYPQGTGMMMMMQGRNEVLGVDGSLKPLSENQPQSQEMMIPVNNDKVNEAHDVINNFVGQEESNPEFSGKGSACKKRKRTGQNGEREEREKLTSNDATEPSIETSSNNTVGSKRGGKNVKEDSGQQAKEGYIHVRARRGQATNSHSLAERVRREKISERMKFLQDLVPGCSKVTGKAVMLDEIINYVQSLQRQVEFLSMKLATVNPRLDLHIEGLLANKDILQHRGVGISSSSSSLHFPMNASLPFPQFHHRTINGLCNNNASPQLTQACGGFKEPMSSSSSQLNLQVPNMWDDDELHNVVEMGFESSGAAPLDRRGSSGSLPEGQMKTEP